MPSVTRRQLAGLAGATIDANGNLVAYTGPLQDLFVNPASGDFRIKDASVPSGIGAFGSGNQFGVYEESESSACGGTTEEECFSMNGCTS